MSNLISNKKEADGTNYHLPLHKLSPSSLMEVGCPDLSLDAGGCHTIQTGIQADGPLDEISDISYPQTQAAHLSNEEGCYLPASA